MIILMCIQAIIIDFSILCTEEGGIYCEGDRAIQGDELLEESALNEVVRYPLNIWYLDQSVIFLQFIKWVSSKDDEDVEKAKEENKKQYSRLMASIAQCEWNDKKSKLVQEMNKTEAKNYEKLYEKIKTDISNAEKEIRDTKEELVKAKQFRRNKMEYDALAKVINENPDRATQGKKIDDIKADLNELIKMEAHLEDKLESRKKQFNVLVQSIHNLQELLDEDEVGFPSKDRRDESVEVIDEVMEIN